MLRPGAYSHVFESEDALPGQIRGLLRPEVIAALGAPFGSSFPGFVAAFPRTTEALERHWPRVELICDQVMGEWLLALAAIREEDNLMARIIPLHDPVDGPQFDEEHSMLPRPWRELYRGFDSFGVTTASVLSISFPNSPVSYAGRLTAKEFCEQFASSAAQARAFEKKVGDRFVCWMWTDAGEGLFLDENRVEGPVYHVRSRDLEDVGVLGDPANFLDSYLAYFLSGGAPATFDISAHRKR